MYTKTSLDKVPLEKENSAALCFSDKIPGKCSVPKNCSKSASISAYKLREPRFQRL